MTKKFGIFHPRWRFSRTPMSRGPDKCGRSGPHFSKIFLENSHSTHVLKHANRNAMLVGGEGGPVAGTYFTFYF